MADSSIIDPTTDLVSETKPVHDLPASTHNDEVPPPPVVKPRLFNRQRSIHQILGGGKHADVILWRHKFMSAGIVGGSTIAWLLFEKSGYTLLTILGNTLLISIVVLFIWSNAATFLNRSPPPLPDLEISEERVVSLALAVRDQINKALAIAHNIALGKDFKQLLKVALVLWGLSIVGGWFHFLTLVYLLIILAHTLPLIYERYEDHIDNYAEVAIGQAHKQYRKIDASVFSKIPMGGLREKKEQ